MPERYLEMLADYDAYVTSHGALEMPEGYEHIRQVILYTSLAIFKRSWPFLLVSVLHIAGGSILLLRRRRSSRYLPN
jgi:hypothetical protein